MKSSDIHTPGETATLVAGSAFDRLSAEDRRLIEDEHSRLESILDDLCDTCQHFNHTSGCEKCEREKLASCQGRLPSYLYDFHDLVVRHIENEETIMSHLLKPEDFGGYLKQHQEEHARLLQLVRQLIRDTHQHGKAGLIAMAIREFSQAIRTLFAEHARTFDAVLLEGTTKDT